MCEKHNVCFDKFHAKMKWNASQWGKQRNNYSVLVLKATPSTNIKRTNLDIFDIIYSL